MSMNKICCLLLAAFMLFFTGCTDVENNESFESESAERISWYIVTDDFLPDKTLEQYSLVNDILTDCGCELDIIFVTNSQANEILGKMISTEKTADIITVERDSFNKHKLLASGLFYDIKELDTELYESVPENIRKEYEVENGRLFCMPGGYFNVPDIASEGVFVRKEYFQLLGEPDMSSTAGFCEAVKKFCDLYEKTYPSKPIPVLFGKNLGGIKTFEHIFGIMPIKKSTGVFYHRIFSQNIDAGLKFLSALGTQYSDMTLRTADEYTFDTVMKNQVFVCFSSEADIMKYNINNPQQQFIRIDVSFSEQGFYEAYKVLGNFATFISEQTEYPAQIAEMIKKISVHDNSLKLMYGEEDVGWVRDNGEIKILDSYKNTVVNSLETAFDDGIAVFPFLSDAGYCNPYLCDRTEKAKDISRLQYYVTPTNYCAAYVREMDEKCVSLYNDCLTETVSTKEAISQLAKLREKGEVLIYSEESYGNTIK